ncbi:hypothetical protein pdam_00014539, partial [Pocillopora damicornis]
GTLKPNCSKISASCHGWKPFDSPDTGDELLGALDLAFLFSYAVGMFFSGFVAEHMDLRHFLTIGMLSRFFQSSGWPSVVECVGNWFGKGRRGLIMGIWNSHTSVGNILGSAIAGVWASGQWGYSFIVPGCIIAGMAIFVFLFLVVDPSHVGCQPPQQHTEPLPNDSSVSTEVVTDSQEGDDGERLLKEPCSYSPKPTEVKRNLEVPSESHISASTVVPPSHGEASAVGFWRAVLIPGVIEYSLCLFFAKLVSYTFLFWLPFYIENTRGILAGFVSDKTKCSGITVVVMLFLAGPMLFVYRFFANANLKVNIALMILSGVLVNGPYALITTAVSANLGTHPCLQGNTKAMATVTAIIDGTGSMGAALGPLLTGIISPTGWNNVFYMLISADIFAAILLSRQVWFEISQNCLRRRERVRLAYLESGHTSLRNGTTYEPHERRSEAEPLLHSS